MRLKSEIWVHAYIRICAVGGAPAFVVRHGDDDAGAIFVKISRLDGTAALFGPAPAGMASRDGGRGFAPLFDGDWRPESDIDSFIASEARFDPDLWLVEVEDAQGRHFLADWLVALEP
jgi:hypothetical protein